MKYLKLFALVILPLLAFSTVHKYYVSLTEIDYKKEKKTVQISTRIFMDDFESMLKQRYDESITLADKGELKTTGLYIEQYLKEKIKIKINGKNVNLNYIGKDYNADIMTCYLEITDVKSIDSFEIKNTVLFDVFQEQNNIIKTKINSVQKSYDLIPQKNSALLTFN